MNPVWPFGLFLLQTIMWHTVTIICNTEKCTPLHSQMLSSKATVCVKCWTHNMTNNVTQGHDFLLARAWWQHVQMHIQFCTHTSCAIHKHIWEKLVSLLVTALILGNYTELIHKFGVIMDSYRWLTYNYGYLWGTNSYLQCKNMLVPPYLPVITS